MRLKLIACKALSRELSCILSLSPNIVDVTWIRQRCHNTPEILHELLQKEIDAIESGEDFHTNKLGIAGNENEITFDAILLGYGLCANATAGLCAKRHKLVIPRAHDCITLLLGPKERYQECFEAFPGCYWYTASWIENSDMPGEEYQKKQEAYYRNQDYDEDTLDYLLEELDGWTQNYKDAAYIRMPFFDKKEYQDFTKQAAAYYHWAFHLLEGKMELMERFISGELKSVLDVPVYILSTGCEICETCVCPDFPCRHPKERLMAVESHGIVRIQLAEKVGMNVQYSGKIAVYFRMVFFSGDTKKNKVSAEKGQNCHA